MTREWIVASFLGSLLAFVPQARADEAALLEKIQALDTKIGQLLEEVQKVSQASPAGIVVASTKPCSDLGTGWAPYTQAAGRFIIGAGTGVDRNNVPLEFEANISRSGEYLHTLTEAEIPRHNHGLVAVVGMPIDMRSADGSTGIGINRPAQSPSGRGKGAGGIDILNVFSQSPAAPELVHDFFVGGNKPHPIMPPYIALYWCKKS